MSRLNRFLHDANRIVMAQNSHSLRRRLNTHHDEDVKKFEREQLRFFSSNLFFKLKEEFVQHREELFNEANGFKEAQTMLRIFEKIVDSDINKILLEEE